MTAAQRLIDRGLAVLEAREQLRQAERELIEELRKEPAVHPRPVELGVRARRRR